MAYVVSNGEISNGIILQNNYMSIFDGGSASDTTISSGGYLYISSGGTADGTTANYYGRVYVFSGGTANDTTVNYLGSVFVSSGGTANGTTLNSGGFLNIYGSGTANKTTVNLVGFLTVCGGGMVNDTTVNSNGSMFVSSGGTANDTTVNSGANLIISSGGTADNVIENGGSVCVREGANVSFVPNEFSGLVLSRTSATVHSGTTANKITVNSTGFLHVSSGGTANDTAVNSGGCLYVSGNGTANNVLENGGVVEVAEGAVVSFAPNSIYGMTLSANASATVHSGTTANKITVNSTGYLHVFSGGTANDTTINAGYLNISSGGTANDTEINTGGFLYIFSSGSAANTTVNAAARLIVSNGGSADSITVNANGFLYVSEGGIATKIVWTPCEGHVYVEGGNATFVSQYSGVYFGSDAQLISHAAALDPMTIGSSEEMYVMSEGTVNDIVIDHYGKMNICSGGRAIGTVVNSRGDILVSSGGSAENTTVNAGGYLYVSSGGAADGISVSSGGGLYVSGGTANNASIKSGGYSYIFSGGAANKASIDSDGYLCVSSGGAAIDATVNAGGYLSVSSGGTLNGISVSPGGYVRVSSGGKLTGRMSFAEGAFVAVFDGACLDFDVSGIAPDTTEPLVDLSFMQYKPDYTLTVSDTQGYGTYVLAKGASGFDRTLLVQNELGEQLGVLSAGEVLGYEENSFRLKLEGETLALTVQARDKVAPTVSNIQVSCAEPTNLPVVVTADFSDNKNELRSTLYRLGNDGEWTAYTDPVTVYRNTTVSFKASDLDGNESELTIRTIDNIGSLNGVVLLSGQSASILANEVFTDTAVSSGGLLVVSSGGTANGITVHSGGSLHVSGGGSAAVIVEDGGYVDFDDGAAAVFGVHSFSGMDLNHASATVHSGTTADSTAINTGGQLIVSSGGVAKSATVNSGGILIVSSGGVANEIAENGGYVRVEDGAELVFKPNVISELKADSNGPVTLHSGTTAAKATVYSGGVLEVFSGGAVNKATVSSGGSLSVSSGGTALNIVWAPWEGGQLNLDADAFTTFDSRAYSGVYWSWWPDNKPVYSSATVSQTGLDGKLVYVMNGGVVCSGTGRYCILTVYGGGVVESEFLGDFGRMTISSGGMARKIQLNGEAIVSTFIRVEAGGVLADAEIRWSDERGGGQIHVSSGGTAIGTIISRGYGAREQIDAGLFLSSGGTAIGTLVGGSSAKFYVNSGCLAISTMIRNNASMSVLSGGTANGTIVGSSAIPDGKNSSSTNNLMDIAGGVANRTTISSGGTVFASDGATVNSVTVQSGGLLRVTQGKLTGRVVCNSGGKIYGNGTMDFNLTDVLPGAVARYNDLSAVTLLEKAVFTLTVNADQAEGTYLLAEGVVDFEQAITVVNADDEKLGTLSVGETVTIAGFAYTLNLSDSVLSLQVGANPVPPPYTSNGLAVGETPVSVQPGEVFYDTRIDPGGILLVSSGGTALKTMENGGYVDVRDGASAAFVSNTVCGLVLEGNSATVHSGTTAFGVSVLSGGSLHVFSGGVATDIVWTPCEGHITVDADASATFASQYSGVYYGSDGQLLSSAATMNTTALGSACEMYVMSGGTADIRSVSGGRISVASGGTAKISSWTPFAGQVEIEGGADVTFKLKDSGVRCGSDGQLLSSANIMDSVMLGASCEMHVMSSGIASRTTVGAGGSLFVYSGGLVNSVVIGSGGEMNVLSGAYAILPVVSSGGRMTVLSGGTAVGIVLHDALLVSSAGMLAATTVSSGGKLVVEAGTADYIVVSSGGSLNVIGGTANSVTVFAEAAMNVCDGGSANALAIDSGSCLYVSSGGTVTNLVLVPGSYLGLSIGTDTFVTGSRHVEGANSNDSFEIMDGVVSGFQVVSGYLEIGAGAVATDVTVSQDGVLYLSSGGKLTGKVICDQGGIISASEEAVINFDLVPWATACISDLSAVQGAPVYTVTIDANQPEAVYTLAEGAAEFNGTITVENKAGAVLGTISVGETVTFQDAVCTLGLADGVLSLQIGTDFVAPTETYNGQVLKINELLSVSSGEVANDTVVNSCVLTGSAGLQVLSGGLANNTTVNDHGCMYVSSGGAANGIILEEGSLLSIESGGIVNHTVIQSNGGMVYISEGVAANDTTINSNGYLRVISGGVANGVTVKSGGNLFVSAGGSATDISVSSGAHLVLMVDTETCAEGVFEGTPFEIRDGVGSDYAVTSSYLYIGAGATIRNATVDSDSRIYVTDGGILTGRVTIIGDGIVSATRESIIDFGIFMVGPGPDALYNDLSLIRCGTAIRKDKPLYTLTVSGLQRSGTYVLAKGAEGFNSSITVRNTSGEELGTLKVSGRLETADYTFTLRLTDGTLRLNVDGPDWYAPTVSDIQASITEPTNRDVVLTAEFEDDVALAQSLYKLGEDGEWTAYVDGVVVPENTTVYFKAVDASGNESEIANYEVTNIDKTPPEAPVVSADATMATSLDVTVTAEFSGDSVVREYSLDGAIWTPYTEGIVFSNNGTVFFRAIDAVGNESETVAYEVANIRKVEHTDCPDNDGDDCLYDKKTGWNDAKVKGTNTVEGDGEIYLDVIGSVGKDGWHNMFGNDGVNKDAGDVARIEVDNPAKLTFAVDSTAAGTFYVYEDGFDKKGNRKQITVGKVSVKAGKTATLGVCLTDTGSYYVAMVAKNVKKAGTEGLYNVEVKDSTFFVDADDGTNNEASKDIAVEVRRGTTSIVLDSGPMKGDTSFANFVGFGDETDYAMLDLASGAYLSFSVKSDGKAKFTIWKQVKGTTGKLSKVTSVSLTVKNGYEASTKAQFLDTDKYTYYASMESTDAKKGGSAYYDVELGGNALFFDSADGGLNNVLYDKKTKEFKDDANFVNTEVSAGSWGVQLDYEPVGNADYGNFVGYGDAVDYARIELMDGGNLSFMLESTGDATFAVCRKTMKKGKLTLETIQTTKLTLAKGESVVEKTTDALANLSAGEYYISMTAKSTKANDKGSVFYNVTAVLDSDSSVVSALAVPEMDNFSLVALDGPSFGQYDASACELADLASQKTFGETGKSGILAGV